jgi:hypothetical protein
MNPSEDIKSLESGDIQKQVSALDSIVSFVIIVINKSLKALKTASEPLLLAERIYNFGSIAVEPLEKMFMETSDKELKIIMAALLVQLESKIGVQTLFDAIKNGSEHQHLAVTSLAKANIRDVCPLIIEKLERLDRSFYMMRENAPFIHTFLAALQRLDYQLPPHFNERFTSHDVPRDLSQFIKKKNEPTSQPWQRK